MKSVPRGCRSLFVGHDSDFTQQTETRLFSDCSLTAHGDRLACKVKVRTFLLRWNLSAVMPAGSARVCVCVCVAAKPEEKKTQGGVTVAVHTHTHTETVREGSSSRPRLSFSASCNSHYSALLPGERRDGLNDRPPAWGVGLDTQGQTRSFRARSSAPPELYGSDFSRTFHCLVLSFEA